MSTLDVIKDVSDSAGALTAALDKILERIWNTKDRHAKRAELGRLVDITTRMTHLAVGQYSYPGALRAYASDSEKDEYPPWLEVEYQTGQLLRSVRDLIELVEQHEGHLVLHERKAYEHLLFVLSARSGILNKIGKELYNPEFRKELPVLADRYEALIAKLDPILERITSYARELEKQV